MKSSLSDTAKPTQDLKNKSTPRVCSSPFIKYFSAFLLFLLFAGCSSTIREGDFSSKEKFLEDFNNTVKTKELKITLLSDSSFTVNEGAAIENDTLFSFGKLDEKKNYQFALSDIEEINFENNSIQRASILLKSGDGLRAENVRTTHDSISFIGTKTLMTKTTIARIDRVKAISYKNHWRNIPLGVITGFFTGGTIGLAIGGLLGEYKEQHFPPGMTDQHPFSPLEKAIGYFISGSFVGLITGGILGWEIGRTIEYQFNP